MLYFSYGSNISSKRLQQRVPSARYVSIAYLTQHELRFHKSSRDGSAKCDAHETGEDDHVIIGVVYDICNTEKSVLDIKEGLGKGYEEKIVEVVTHAGEIIETYTYYATHIDPRLKPYNWYKEHVLQGAMEYGFPDDYVTHIASIESIVDPVPERDGSELEIYL